jgi:hypothetical protein
MWIVKASAAEPELVQMLDVAFSRRMCCSRVDRVSTKPRRPSASTVSPPGGPASGARISGAWRTEPDIGPPKLSPLPMRLALAHHDVGAHARRAASTRPSETTSVNTAISSAPWAWAFSAIGRGRRDGRTRPATAPPRRRSRRRSPTGCPRPPAGTAGARRPRGSPCGRDSPPRRDNAGAGCPKHRLLAPGQAMGHQHRLAAAGRAVIHGGVGHLHAGQRATWVWNSNRIAACPARFPADRACRR